MGPARGGWRPKVYKDVGDYSSKNSLLFFIYIGYSLFVYMANQIRRLFPQNDIRQFIVKPRSLPNSSC